MERRYKKLNQERGGRTEAAPGSPGEGRAPRGPRAGGGLDSPCAEFLDKGHRVRRKAGMGRSPAREPGEGERQEPEGRRERRGAGMGTRRAAAGRDGASRPSRAPLSRTHLLEQLQAVGVVVVGEEEHPGLRGRQVLVPLPQPGQAGVALLGGAGQPRALVAARRGDVQVRAGQPGARHEAGHQLAARRRVLHQDPVEPRHLPEGVGQAGELGLLHRAAVGGRDGIDGGQRGLGPPPRGGWPRPAATALGPAAGGQRGQRRPAAVDVQHDDDDEHPGQQQEEAAEEQGLHAAPGALPPRRRSAPPHRRARRGCPTALLRGAPGGGGDRGGGQALPPSLLPCRGRGGRRRGGSGRVAPRDSCGPAPAAPLFQRPPFLLLFFLLPLRPRHRRTGARRGALGRRSFSSASPGGSGGARGRGGEGGRAGRREGGREGPRGRGLPPRPAPAAGRGQGAAARGAPRSASAGMGTRGATGSCLSPRRATTSAGGRDAFPGPAPAAGQGWAGWRTGPRPST